MDTIARFLAYRKTRWARLEWDLGTRILRSYQTFLLAGVAATAFTPVGRDLVNQLAFKMVGTPVAPPIRSMTVSSTFLIFLVLTCTVVATAVVLFRGVLQFLEANVGDSLDSAAYVRDLRSVRFRFSRVLRSIAVFHVVGYAFSPVGPSHEGTWLWVDFAALFLVSCAQIRYVSLPVRRCMVREALLHEETESAYFR